MTMGTFHWLAGIGAAAMLSLGFGAETLLPWAAAAASSGALAARRATRRTRSRGDATTLRARPTASARDGHLARTVHELRTPLCTVAAALELMRGAPGGDSGANRDLLDDALLATEHLTHLVGDVLDEAALTAGRLRLAVGSHRVRALLDDCVRLLRRQAARGGHRLEPAAVPAELAVRTDPHRFLQITGNLVRNALAVAPPGSAVCIEVHADRHRVRFAVIDRGPGVPEDVRSRLFLPFTTGAQSGGTGLGLHVSMRLVRQMGGRIGHAATDAGTAFWFELPRALARIDPLVVAPPLHAAASAP